MSATPTTPYTSPTHEFVPMETILEEPELKCLHLKDPPPLPSSAEAARKAVLSGPHNIINAISTQLGEQEEGELVERDHVDHLPARIEQTSCDIIKAISTQLGEQETSETSDEAVQEEVVDWGEADFTPSAIAMRQYESRSVGRTVDRIMKSGTESDSSSGQSWTETSQVSDLYILLRDEGEVSGAKLPKLFEQRFCYKLRYPAGKKALTNYLQNIPGVQEIPADSGPNHFRFNAKECGESTQEEDKCMQEDKYRKHMAKLQQQHLRRRQRPNSVGQDQQYKRYGRHHAYKPMYPESHSVIMAWQREAAEKQEAEVLAWKARTPPESKFASDDESVYHEETLREAGIDIQSTKEEAIWPFYGEFHTRNGKSMIGRGGRNHQRIIQGLFTMLGRNSCFIRWEQTTSKFIIRGKSPQCVTVAENALAAEDAYMHGQGQGFLRKYIPLPSREIAGITIGTGGSNIKRLTASVNSRNGCSGCYLHIEEDDEWMYIRITGNNPFTIDTAEETVYEFWRRHH